MPINREHLDKYLNDIAQEVEDVRLVLLKDDKEILRDRHLLKSLKYSVIVIAEGIGGIFQHILAKQFHVAISGYTEVFVKAKEHQILPYELIDRLLPFARFRNMIVHQYWRVEESVFLKNIKEGIPDFIDLIDRVKENYK